MSKVMRRDVIVVLVCALAWLIVGAILMPMPQSVRDWAAYAFISLGWMAIGFGFGGIAGYNTARKEGMAKPPEQNKTP